LTVSATRERAPASSTTLFRSAARSSGAAWALWAPLYRRLDATLEGGATTPPSPGDPATPGGVTAIWTAWCRP
jgi:hypothetical protein